MNIEVELSNIKNMIESLKQDIVVTKPSKAAILIQEYLNNEDLDNNGLIYGYDFKIKNDNQLPEILKEFQKKFKNKIFNTEYEWKEVI